MLVVFHRRLSAVLLPDLVDRFADIIPCFTRNRQRIHNIFNPVVGRDITAGILLIGIENPGRLHFLLGFTCGQFPSGDFHRILHHVCVGW